MFDCSMALSVLWILWILEHFQLVQIYTKSQTLRCNCYVFHVMYYIWHFIIQEYNFFVVLLLFHDSRSSLSICFSWFSFGCVIRKCSVALTDDGNRIKWKYVQWTHTKSTTFIINEYVWCVVGSILTSSNWSWIYFHNIFHWKYIFIKHGQINGIFYAFVVAQFLYCQNIVKIE